MGEHKQHPNAARELNAAIKRSRMMSQIYGKQFGVGHFKDGLDTSTLNLDEPTVVQMCIGERGMLYAGYAKAAAKAFSQIRQTPGKHIYLLFVAGFDDCSEELWEIPWVRNHVCNFARRTEVLTDYDEAEKLLDQQSLVLLVACGVYANNPNVKFAYTEDGNPMAIDLRIRRLVMALMEKHRDLGVAELEYLVNCAIQRFGRDDAAQAVQEGWTERRAHGP